MQRKTTVGEYYSEPSERSEPSIRFSRERKKGENTKRSKGRRVSAWRSFNTPHLAIRTPSKMYRFSAFHTFETEGRSGENLEERARKPGDISDEKKVVDFSPAVLPLSPKNQLLPFETRTIFTTTASILGVDSLEVA